MSDRPLRRRLIKLAFSLNRARAHGQEAWPGLSLERPRGNAPGQVTWRGRPLTTLLPLATLPRAGTITVVGSGPSMRDMDPARLPGLPILLNGAAQLVPALGRPALLAVEDERFVWRRGAMIRAIPEGTTCLFSVAVLRALAEQEAEWLRDRPVFLLDNLLKPYGGPRRSLDDPAVAPLVLRDGVAAASRDPQSGVVGGGTVAFSATQVALALAGDRVALAGVDLANADRPRFYESAGDRAASGLLKGRDRILAHFRAALALARERGLALDLVTPGSALEGIGLPCRPPAP